MLNIPEATIWFQKRFDVPLFKFILLFNLLINFVAPFLLILKRSAKRNFKLVSFVAVLIIIGHYLDFYGMIMLEPMNVPHHTTEDEHHASASTNSVLYAEQTELAATDSTVIENVEGAVEEVATDAVEEVATEAAAAVTGHTESSEEKHHDAAHGAAAAESHGNHGEEHAATNLATIGLPEIFIFIGFLGLFLFVVFTTLNDKELEVTEDPFLKESLHHHFDY